MAKSPFAGIPALQQIEKLARKNKRQVRAVVTRTSPRHSHYTCRKSVVISDVLFYIMSARVAHYPNNGRSRGYAKPTGKPHLKEDGKRCEAVGIAVNVLRRGRRIAEEYFLTLEEFSKAFPEGIVAIPLGKGVDKPPYPKVPWPERRGRKGLKRCLDLIKAERHQQEEAAFRIAAE